jgi:hypothetical protein
MRSAAGILCVAVAACAVGTDGGEPTSSDPAAAATSGDVTFSADTRVLESFPVQLRTSVVATNRGGSPVQLTFPDGCVVLLRAFHEGGTTPVWDQRDGTVCTMSLVEATLEPGASKTWEARTDAREILGRSLPDGRYRLEAYLRPRSGTIVLAAGTVDLAVPR